MCFSADDRKQPFTFASIQALSPLENGVIFIYLHKDSHQHQARSIAGVTAHCVAVGQLWWLPPSHLIIHTDASLSSASKIYQSIVLLGPFQNMIDMRGLSGTNRLNWNSLQQFSVLLVFHSSSPFIYPVVGSTIIHLSDRTSSSSLNHCFCLVYLPPYFSFSN